MRRERSSCEREVQVPKERFSCEQVYLLRPHPLEFLKGLHMYDSTRDAEEISELVTTSSVTMTGSYHQSWSRFCRYIQSSETLVKDVTDPVLLKGKKCVRIPHDMAVTN